MNDKKFVCSRQERGAKACDAQCAQCASRDSSTVTRNEDVDPHGAGPAQPGTSAPTASTERKALGQLTVTLYEDGGVQVDGPFHDLPLFNWLVFLAERALGGSFARMQRQAQEQRVQVAKAVAPGAKGWFNRFRRNR